MIEARPLKKEDVVHFKCHPDFIEKEKVLGVMDWLKQEYRNPQLNQRGIPVETIIEILDEAVREIK